MASIAITPLTIAAGMLPANLEWLNLDMQLSHRQATLAPIEPMIVLASLPPP
jgi:hypothetical protein